MNIDRKSAFHAGVFVALATFLFALSTATAEEDVLLHWRFEPQEEYIEPDASGHGHDAQLLRYDHDRSEPERVSESIHGPGAGSVRLTRDSRIQLLEPVDIPENWTLSFWIKDERSEDDIPEQIVAGDYVRIRSGPIGLSNPWYFRLDPRNEGKEEGWYDGENGEEWEEIKVPAFWEETHVGEELGYGWYKTTFYVPEEYADMPHELHFESVDETAWVYVNGEYIGRDEVGEWDVPFSVTVEPRHLKAGEENLLVVQTFAEAQASGIYRPVYFLPPEEKRFELDLSNLAAERATPGEWEHIAVTFEPEAVRMYVNGVLVDTADKPLPDNGELGRAVIEFYQRGSGHFGGLVDDVRLYAGALSDSRIAKLSDGFFHTDAPWMEEYDEKVQEIARIGRLSRERTQYMTELGVPDTAAVIDTFETADELNVQLDAVWALGAIGDYDATAKLIKLLEAKPIDISIASEEALEIAVNEEHYPASLVARDDDEAVSLLETLLMETVNPKLQEASVDGLREAVGDYEATVALAEKLEADDKDLTAGAAEGLLRLNEKNIFPDVLVDRADEDAAALLENVTKLSADHNLQWESVRGLAELEGDYRALSLLIGKLSSDVDALFAAAEDGVMRFYDDDLFPQMMVERGDEESVELIGTVLHSSRKPTLQTAALEALEDVEEEKAQKALAMAAEKGNWRLQRIAAQKLAEQGVDTDPVLITEAEGWPMWRYDPASSADPLHSLPEDLHLHWERELPEPQRAWPQQQDDGSTLQFDVSYSPVAADGRVFVPSMVTDSVTAYSLEDGSQLWRFHADGPVRLAPAVWRGKVYFTSDDGHLYCFDAESGEMQWKFRGGPSDLRLLGNARVVSMWYGRTGPVIEGGTVYFTAGTWPIHGVFVYALDAETGDVQWVNDTISLDMYGTGTRGDGLSPQGYIAADDEEIVVAGGRSAGHRFNRHTGESIDNIGIGWSVTADEEPRAGYQSNSMLNSRVDALSDEIDGSVFYKLAADGRLIGSTGDGRLLCFGEEETETVQHEYRPGELDSPDGRWADVAGSLLEERTESGGYALVLGAGSGDLMRALIKNSDMHVVVVDDDTARVRELRDELIQAGKYGGRAAVIETAPADFNVQPYLFELIVSEDAGAAGLDGGEAQMAHLLDRLRPYSGRAWLGASEGRAEQMADAATTAEVDQVSVGARSDHMHAGRGGPLTGAGEWTHQWQCPANSLTSDEERVRLPLGLLWFGGPTNHNILPRHAPGPARRWQAAGRCSWDPTT